MRNYSLWLTVLCSYLLITTPVFAENKDTKMTETGSKVSRITQRKDNVVCLMPDKFHRILDGSFWHLTKLQTETPPLSLDITLSFHNGTASGYAGCNSYAASFVSPTETLFGIRDLETTKRKCAKEVCPAFESGATWEEKYLALLPNMTKMEKTAQQLVLKDEDDKSSLVFEALKP